jgi:UDP-glucose:(heptosyl)LPS alpha-1,3-glucosyltransferase
MNIAFAYESVLPARGGCEHYISDLARRLVRDGHSVHLYATRWDASSLPAAMNYHPIPQQTGPRFIRPWRFANAVLTAMQLNHHDVTIGFDKTYGQDLLYPQGGLHAASAKHNIWKHPSGLNRSLAKLIKFFDPAHRSFSKLERRQYLTEPRPRIVVNSKMVLDHFTSIYGIPPKDIFVLPSAIDPERFSADDRPRRRAEERGKWNVSPEVPVGLFVGMNYRLKGLTPLLQAITRIPSELPFKAVIVGSSKFQSYQKLVNQLGISERVQFEGFRADPKDCFFGADFLIHPTFYDPCSLVVLESLACGLPVITTKFNGASELYIDGVEGLVISDPHRTEELANAIIRMLDPTLRSSMTTASRLAAQRWTFDQHYRQLLKLFEQIAERKQAA